MNRHLPALLHLLLLLPLLWVSAASAQATPRDYTAEVPLETDSASARASALREGLALVLERVAGRPVADVDLEAADRWVQHFGVARAEDAGLVLRAGFDPGSIDRALRDLGYPVWGAFAGDRQQWRLRIEGLRTPGDLARIYTALKQPGTDALRIDAVEGHQLDLRVTTANGVMLLEQALAQAGAVRLYDRGDGGLLRYQLR
jgi:hypothetical protein